MDILTPQERSQRMSLIRSKDTIPELIVRRLVHRLGYRFRLHVRQLPGTPDLVLRRHLKIINVSGCFWHDHGCRRSTKPKTNRSFWTAKLTGNKHRDQKNRRALRRLGWDVFTVWECEIGRPELLAERLKQFLAR